MKVISSEKLPIKMWIENIEDGALEQAKNLANLPFLFKHVAIMPDSHQGYGMPIGGVIATKGVVIPNAVGVDIGCGMCAFNTGLYAKDVSKEQLKLIMGMIRQEIPLGFNHHSKKQDEQFMPLERSIPLIPGHQFDQAVVIEEYESALKQIGTLGGGNHFIEIQKDTLGFVWVMLHSGSRNLGKKVADYYNKLANHFNAKWFSQIPKEWQLAFLPLDSEQGEFYLNEMNYCVEFALANRKLMMNRILDIFKSVFDYWRRPIVANMINIAHNYAVMEHHYGENVLVHRKGATKATVDTIGIIPGSQGSKSYIIKGKGNSESFNSCSHGAGRKMGRKEASRTLNLEEEIKKMDDLGVIHGIRNQGDLDEAAGAYKNIDEVMAQQSDLVEIVTELTPLAVIKG